MCCFSAKTEVHGTRIFARQKAAGTQTLVYQMKYSASEPTAMILPLPVALPTRENAVGWTSLKEYPSFFDDLDNGFPEKPPSQGLFASKSAAIAAAPALAVHEVGDFIASFVPSVKDFDRVDPRFAIARDVWAQIPQYADYGFAVFQLKELAGSPHPIAFDFASRLGGRIFFPTVHIHDGTVHREDAFDHMLYVQDARYDARAGDYDGPEQIDDRTGFVRSKERASAFGDVPRSAGVLAGELLVHRMPIVGMHRNEDVLVDPEPSRSRGACGRCDAARPQDAGGDGIGAASAAMAGLAWIIRRRTILRRHG